MNNYYLLERDDDFEQRLGMLFVEHLRNKGYTAANGVLNITLDVTGDGHYLAATETLKIFIKFIPDGPQS